MFIVIRHFWNNSHVGHESVFLEKNWVVAFPFSDLPPHCSAALSPLPSLFSSRPEITFSSIVPWTVAEDGEHPRYLMAYIPIYRGIRRDRVHTDLHSPLYTEEYPHALVFIWRGSLVSFVPRTFYLLCPLPIFFSPPSFISWPFSLSDFFLSLLIMHLPIYVMLCQYDL